VLFSATAEAIVTIQTGIPLPSFQHTPKPGGPHPRGEDGRVGRRQLYNMRIVILQGGTVLPEGEYVHGYSEREAARLHDQAGTLAGLLHHDTVYPTGSRVLEAGCGVGAQTLFLARNSPGASFSCVDVSEESIRQASALLEGAGASNVEFRVADLFDLPGEEERFDHVFCCFLLEHLAEPLEALKALGRLLREGGTITAIEGDHGSCFFHPDSEHARLAIRCLVESQRRLGGNALIGRELYPLLSATGFRDVAVSPRMVYVDASRPELVEGFTRNTFIAMVEGARDRAVEMGLAPGEEIDLGVRDLYRTAEPDGAFCYTFFKGTAWK
jgi:SAM-dependent methyltransferase